MDTTTVERSLRTQSGTRTGSTRSTAFLWRTGWVDCFERVRLSTTVMVTQPMTVLRTWKFSAMTIILECIDGRNQKTAFARSAAKNFSCSRIKRGCAGREQRLASFTALVHVERGRGLPDKTTRHRATWKLASLITLEDVGANPASAKQPRSCGGTADTPVSEAGALTSVQVQLLSGPSTECRS